MSDEDDNEFNHYWETTMDAEQLKARADATRKAFEEKWGGFRRFISANPLTGFWIGVGVGSLAGAGMGRETLTAMLSVLGLA